MARLRIIAGSRKGHQIKVAREAAVRPTSERVREALFAALGDIDGLRVLDLFAGTGALGLEALSRGAAQATFVEADRQVAAVLRANIARLRFDEQAEVLLMDYSRALPLFASGGRAFDLLFVDPPYRMLPDVARTLTPHIPELLSPAGLAIIEGPRRSPVDLGLPVVFERRYGDTVISMVAGQEASH